MEDDITLANLPSDVIRTIIVTDHFQASFDSLRLISRRWKDHISEIMRDTEKLPIIPQFRWTEDQLCWNFFLKISFENEEYFGIEWPYNKETREFEEVYYKNMTSKGWLMNRVKRFFKSCSCIEKVVLDFALISEDSTFEIGKVKVRELQIKDFEVFKVSYEKSMVKFIRRASVERVVMQFGDEYVWHTNAASLDSFLSKAIQKTPSIEIITTTIATNQATIRAELKDKLAALVNTPLQGISPVRRHCRRYAGRYRIEPGRPRCVVRIFVEPWNPAN